MPHVFLSLPETDYYEFVNSLLFPFGIFNFVLIFPLFFAGINARMAFFNALSSLAPVPRAVMYVAGNYVTGSGRNRNSAGVNRRKYRASTDVTLLSTQVAELFLELDYHLGLRFCVGGCFSDYAVEVREGGELQFEEYFIYRISSHKFSKLYNFVIHYNSMFIRLKFCNRIFTK